MRKQAKKLGSGKILLALFVDPNPPKTMKLIFLEAKKPLMIKAILIYLTVQFLLLIH